MEGMIIRTTILINRRVIITINISNHNWTVIIVISTNSYNSNNRRVILVVKEKKVNKEKLAKICN